MAEAHSELWSADGSVSGTVSFEQAHEDAPLVVRGDLAGLEAGARHGLHIHEDAVEPGQSCDLAGGHYDPHDVSLKSSPFPFYDVYAGRRTTAFSNYRDS